ncbi:regulator of chromosome condensation 1/beta-lactamase-inhibitor protein II [Lophiotrema nucula]|uniref:Regulator of chromosome condensation 1/beta-lactamase-inhibitor protein II n=1 Tax=Lophiotrema nucula TaxID=690887 RepID=A0A6A5Z3A0_9PLEO|nr:regulator of chromosome condensation 1/beta-lactamase-inhibitor protein II [Lophiotrema nucula]
MAERVSSITDLPLDILVLVFPYLDAKSFLSFCSTCKAFQQDSIRLDPAYWSHATRSTFRVPNQPIVQHDGVRWQKLYRRLLTQSRVFTWGSNTYNRLGHSSQRDVPAGPVRLPRHLPRRRFAHSSSCSFPTEMDNTRDLGVIADMQCGGWSTTLLASKGLLYTVGVLDGMQVLHNHSADNGPQLLRFPAAYPYSTGPAAYEEPTIAIRQFSSGRCHILGLSDSGRIWSWYAVHKPALHVKFLNIDVNDSSSTPSYEPSTYGRIRKVVAGWSRSSAFVNGTGIVVWDPVQRDAHQNDDEVDTMLVLDAVEVPRTGYQRAKGASRESPEERVLGEEVGVVLNYIMLEHFVIFVTDIGKIFCAKFGDKNRVEEILELQALRNALDSPSDVQGSFRRFAVFKNGEVIIGDQDYLEACWNARMRNPEQTDIDGLKYIPALQQNNVISIAFGDYHFIALHSTGKITSYGTELQACGALGLGGDGDPEGRIRGIRYTGFGHDGKLLPHAYTHGRQVWFEPEKKKFMTFMTSGGKDPDEAKERMRLFVTDPAVQGELSEWFEQEGRSWDDNPAVKEADEDGLGSYFALSISAAGWHSGAVVLVNAKLAAQVQRSYIVKDPDAVDETNNTEDQQPEGTEPIGMFASSLSWLTDLGRWFLGLQTVAEQQQSNLQDVFHPHGLSDFLDPIAYGASPEKGYKYVWADKSFPRLKLSDGQEMPGTVDFDEWKNDIPEWKLDIEV